MCLECCKRRLPELIAHCEREGMRLRRGRILVCAVSHGDHSHLRFRSRGSSRMHSPWFQMPAALPILLQVLPPSKFSLHLHQPWQNDEAETKGLDTPSKEALAKHKHVFIKLRLDDTCPICLDCVPTQPILLKEGLLDDGSGGGELASSTTLPCGHAFHDTCCGEWFSRSKKCPTCRFELTAPSIEAAAARVRCLEESGEYQQCDKGLGWLRAETTKAGGLAAAAAVAQSTANANALSWGDEEEEEDDDLDYDGDGSFFNPIAASLNQAASLMQRIPRPSFRWSSSSQVSPTPSQQSSSLLATMFRQGRHMSRGSSFNRGMASSSESEQFAAQEVSESELEGDTHTPPLSDTVAPEPSLTSSNE